MDIIFNDSNNNIGGIEIMFIEMAKALSVEHNVYFVVNENSIYEKELSKFDNIKFVKKRIQRNIEFISSNLIKKERESVLSQLNLSKQYYVISPYYNKLQYSLAIFNKNNFKHINLWAHPENWARQSKLKSKKKFVKKISHGKKFYYQQKLLVLFEEKNAHFFGARAVPVFNSWYYSVPLNPNKINTLPIQPVQTSPKRLINENVKEIKVVWCGRFDYFKNEAIIEISRVLSSLSNSFPEYDVKYGIIGFGSDYDKQYISENIEKNGIRVEFIGKVSPEKLPVMFKEYDVGIGMGLTVKKMAQVGLPSIVIDSFTNDSNHKKNSNWIFDTKEGDAGDGYYYKIAGSELIQRKELYSVLGEVFNRPEILQDYSVKSLNFVNKHYSFEDQMNIFLKKLEESSFNGGDFPFFRRNIFYRLIYKIYNFFK
ncbi:glycosyltransferase [Halobacillus halophilus]|uniref:glycosyltransferase n=1 Tax=Halobacillus halophilus TaxID=1570 RepID=UPI001CD3A17F|nr:glycosyltransferase [Halobacillus halophilus]MCA1010722.1 glycosyltransferase [Halobacillus halophilus]